MGTKFQGSFLYSVLLNFILEGFNSVTKSDAYVKLINVFCNSMKIELLVYNIVHAVDEIIIKHRTFLTKIDLFLYIIRSDTASHIGTTVFCMDLTICTQH